MEEFAEEKKEAAAYFAAHRVISTLCAGAGAAPDQAELKQCPAELKQQGLAETVEKAGTVAITLLPPAPGLEKPRPTAEHDQRYNQWRDEGQELQS